MPFKNNGAQELEIEFSFARKSAVIAGPLFSAESKVAVSSPLEFSIG